MLVWLGGVKKENDSPSPHREADIIFIHGLSGHYHSTWHPQESKKYKIFWRCINTG